MKSAKGIYRILGLLLKIIIAASSLVYIYIKLTDSSQINALTDVLSANTHALLYLIAVVLLMFVNWALEALKWKILAAPHESISWVLSCKSILAGITMSVFTPNRVGEFGGKIFFLQKANRLKALVSSIIGSYSQLCVTLFFGALAMCFYFSVSEAEPSNDLMLSISVFFLLSVIGLMLLYLYPDLIVARLSAIKKWKEYMEVVSFYSTTTLMRIMQYSFIRYIIFSIQFYLLLKVFSVDIPTLNAFIMIALTFLGITIVPTITITELGVRGSAALLFLGEYSNNHTGIVAASFALWLINIALPAIAGVSFVFKLTFFRNE